MSDPIGIGTEDVVLSMRVTVPTFRVGDVLRRAWDLSARVNPKAYAEIFFSVLRVDLRGTYSVVDGKSSVTSSSGEVFGVIQRGNTVDGAAIRPGQVLAFDPTDLVKNATKVEWKDPVVDADTADNVDDRLKSWDAARRTA